jgi:uncharacterized membrane protein (DUF4010 family)
MELSAAFVQLGIALGVGLLIGLQRERKTGDIAGFRTFTLVCLTGTLCGQLSAPLGGWVVAAALLALAALIYVGNMAKIHAGRPEPGLTTEISLLLIFGVGVYLAVGPPQVAVAVAGATAVLLQLKQELHGFAARIGDRDLLGIIQFVLVTMVILPVLPDRDYGPWGVLNPREIWWMVVLVVGLSLAAYVGLKLLGERGGTIAGGALGGMVSSTAATLAVARRAAAGELKTTTAARIALIAAAMVYVRVLVEIAVVAPQQLSPAMGPLLFMLALLLTLVVVAWRRDRGDGEEPPTEARNPAQLRAALVFGALYAAVLLAAAWARDRWGISGLFGVAAVTGLVDVNAITLSTARLSREGGISADLLWRVVLLATLANLLFKGVLVAIWSSRDLARRLAPWFLVALLGGGVVLALWPGEGALFF